VPYFVGFLGHPIKILGTGFQGQMAAGIAGIYSVRKKHPERYRLSVKEMSTNYNNFWYKYFWHNWPSNDRPIYQLTQCLLLHNLGKKEPTKYALK